MTDTLAHPAAAALSVVPPLGLGTFRLKGDVVQQSVRTALELGYRAIDTAQIYENEADVGSAIAASGVPRQDLFLTTKIWVAHLGADALIPSLQQSLEHLRTDHVDLTLIHWPSRDVPLQDSLRALQRARELGLTRHIGVSNFNTALLQQAIDTVGADQIATHQIELSPYLQNRAVVDFARQHGIHTTSYMTLGYGKLLGEPVLTEIATAHGASPAQVALAWAMQHGIAVIPSSTQRAHLQSNLASRTLRLSADDMARIDALERGDRQVSPEGLAPVWD